LIDGGTPLQVYTAQGTQVTTISLPSTGPHTIRWIDGNQNRSGDTGDITTAGTLVQLSVPSGGQIVLSAPTKLSDAVFVPDDFISVSAGASRIDLGWLPRLRGLLGWDVAAYGYGSKGYVSLQDPTAQQALVSAMQTYFAGRSGRKAVPLDLGTNDYGLNYLSPADVATIAGQVADAIH
jgi:hypothetical protein